MKIKLFKVYILLFFLIYNVVLYSQPGNNDNNGSLEGTDPPAPIDNYIVILGLIGVFYVFREFKTIAK